MWPFKDRRAEPKMGKQTMEQRMARIEHAIETFGEVAEKFEKFAERVTVLEENKQSSASMFQRAFSRLESVETAIKGDGTDSNPGLYATQLVVKTEIQAMAKNLAANTWWTRSVALAIVLSILAWAGNTLLAASRTSTPAVVQTP